jgi:DNA processing protein
MDRPLRPLSDIERLAWLRLIRSENVGPITFRLLLERFGTASEALDALPDLSRRGGRSKPVRIPPPGDTERELAALDKLGARLVALCEADYPPALAAADDAPPLLALRGRTDLLQRPAVALVGARNASANGRTIAKLMAAALAEAGWLVVSGFARGIDTAAHQGALPKGTAAVLAGGPDVVYPPENAALYADLLEAGTIVSEMPPGSEPQGRHFPRRNRIIAGLAMGTVVVEAAQKSGSLHTARLAAEYGREVMAVPGSPLDPRSSGCNRLLREGATLVESAEHVAEALQASASAIAEPLRPGFQTAARPAPPPQDQGQAFDMVMELLSPAPVSVDELIRQCQLSAALVGTVLLDLELAGRLERHPGNRVALIA